MRAGPVDLDAAVDQPPRHDTETLRIEITQLDYVDRHDPLLARRRRHASRR
jgi:hypothetical protein